jgi:hypothetical protein
VRKLLILLMLTLAFGAGGYELYQQPEIRVLFQASQQKGDPLEFLENLPKVSPKPPPPKLPSRMQRPAQNPPAASSPASREVQAPDPDVHNQVPNDEVARAMLGILAARKLGRHLSVTVTDKEITVYGEVGSAEERQQIRDILEKGREMRRVNVENLTVGAADAGGI